MIKSIYSHIVVLGTGKLAFYCGKLIRVETVRQKRDKL